MAVKEDRDLLFRVWSGDSSARALEVRPHGQGISLSAGRMRLERTATGGGRIVIDDCPIVVLEVMSGAYDMAIQEAAPDGTAQMFAALTKALGRLAEGRP